MLENNLCRHTFFCTPRSLCKRYIQQWKARLAIKESTKALKIALEQLEDSLDVFNITVCRKQAESEVCEPGRGALLTVWLCVCNGLSLSPIPHQLQVLSGRPAESMHQNSTPPPPSNFQEDTLFIHQSFPTICFLLKQEHWSNLAKFFSYALPRISGFFSAPCHTKLMLLPSLGRQGQSAPCNIIVRLSLCLSVC